MTTRTNLALTFALLGLALVGPGARAADAPGPGARAAGAPGPGARAADAPGPGASDKAPGKARAPGQLKKRAAKEQAWIPLFNGKDLDGWQPKFRGQPVGVNYKDTFRVDQGVLKASFEKWEKWNGEFGHLVYKRPFSNYRIRIEYRFVGDQVTGGPGWANRNSGVMLHGQPPETMDKDQEFPVSIEAQFLGGKGTGERPTGNVCSPGTNFVRAGKLVTDHCTNSTSKTFHGEQWVTFEAEVRGSQSIKHVINGETVFEYAEPQLDDRDEAARKLMKDGKKRLDGGYIYLQAESHPVEFRKVELLPLD